LLARYNLPRLDNELASEIIPCRHLIDEPLAGVRFHFDGAPRVGFHEPGEKRLMPVYDDPFDWSDSHVMHSIERSTLAISRRNPEKPTFESQLQK
jgi:hypothetical protein